MPVKNNAYLRHKVLDKRFRDFNRQYCIGEASIRKYETVTFISM